jgi:hypothetical protein
MCIQPVSIPEVGMAACRYCWQCQNNRVNDLVGRCIAEKQVSTATVAVTLTYREDKPNSAVLVYSDFQRFMKRLRKAKYDVRYIVAGEYGSRKGRAHWHAILFFRGKSPEVHINSRIDWEYWPEGFSYFQAPDYGGFRYVLKYVLKDQSGQRAFRNHLAMSKKPPLGHDYFVNLARHHVERGLAPQGGFYTFGDEFDSKGRRRRFMLQGRMKEIYNDTYLDTWAKTYGTEPPPSDYIEDHEDKQIAKHRAATYCEDEWKAYLHNRPLPPRQKEEPLPHGYHVEDGQRVGHRVIGYIVHPESGVIFDHLDDGTILIDDGNDAPWRVIDEAQLGEAIKILALPPKAAEQIASAICNAAFKRGLPQFGAGGKS